MLVFARVWSVPLHCSMVICFSLLQSPRTPCTDLEECCVQLWEWCQCPALLWTRSGGCSETGFGSCLQHGSTSLQGSTLSRVADTPCTRGWQPCPAVHTSCHPVLPVSSLIKDSTATWMCLCLVHCCKPWSVDQARLRFSASTKAPGLAVPHSLGRKCSPRNPKPPFPTAQAAGTGGIFATVPLRA